MLLDTGATRIRPGPGSDGCELRSPGGLIKHLANNLNCEQQLRSRRLVYSSAASSPALPPMGLRCEVIRWAGLPVVAAGGGARSNSGLARRDPVHRSSTGEIS